MRRATADTNVLVSALMYRHGKPFQFLRMALEGEISLAVSQSIIDETLDVPVRKFGVTVSELPEYTMTILDAARLVRPTVLIDVVKDDPDDNRILECAASAGSDYIVSGDKHLLKLGRYDSIQIVKLSAFLGLELGPRQESIGE